MVKSKIKTTIIIAVLCTAALLIIFSPVSAAAMQVVSGGQITATGQNPSAAKFVSAGQLTATEQLTFAGQHTSAKQHAIREQRANGQPAVNEQLVVNRQLVANKQLTSAKQATVQNLTDANLRLNCPLRSCKVLTAFAVGKQNWEPGHRGVDLSATESSAVFAPADGEVIYAGMLVDRNVVSIRHAGDYRSTFEPVVPLVSVGDKVTRGELIALAAAGHCSAEKCLHWGFKFGSDGYLNPLDYLLRKRVRLLS